MGFTWVKPITVKGQITAEAVNEIRTNTDWIDNHHDAASGYYCAAYYASQLTAQYSAQCPSNYDYYGNYANYGSYQDNACNCSDAV